MIAYRIKVKTGYLDKTGTDATITVTMKGKY